MSTAGDQISAWMRKCAETDARNVKKLENLQGTVEAATEAFLDFVDARGNERAVIKGAVLAGMIYGTHFIAFAARRAVPEEETEQQSQQCIDEQWLSEQW